ncbi:17470_t:CDS:2, partial [Gigaspora rosea]
LSEQRIPKCDETYWHSKNIMNHLYNNFLRRYTISSIQWHKFFIDWKNSSSTIIEFHSSLASIYPPQHIFNDHELRAWRALLKAAGCHDITPFTEYKSKVQFWSRSLNALQDQHTLAQLHSQGLLILSPNNTSDKLWECFKNSYNMNKRGQDG